MLHAENKCKRGQRLPWSPAVHKVTVTMYILRIHLNMLKTSNDQTGIICRLQSTLTDTHIPLPSSIKETHSALRKNQQEYYRLARASNEERLSALKEREDAFILANTQMDPKRAAALFWHSQDLHLMNKQLPKDRTGSSGQETLLVPTPMEDDEVQHHRLTDAQEIEEVIISRNRRHFSQAKEAPLSSEAIIDEIVPAADTKTAERILDGTAHLPSLTQHKWSQLLLEQCQRKLKELKFCIDPHVIKRKIQGW